MLVISLSKYGLIISFKSKESEAELPNATSFIHSCTVLSEFCRNRRNLTISSTKTYTELLGSPVNEMISDIVQR